MKFLIFLILFLCCFKQVDAKVYYSEYNDFSKYSTEIVEASDIVDVEVERRYKWYRFVAQGDFYRMGENPFSYNYTNVKIYRDGEFSQWSSEYPGEYFGRIIETRENCDSGECVNEYRYKDRFYYFYKEVKQEKEGYYTYILHYLRNKDDYKDYYRYRVRDKIEIPESIVITSGNKTLEDFIQSTVNYEVIGNIDYSKNGAYEVVIKTDFIEVPTTIEVLIPGRIKSYYEELIMKQELTLEEKENLIETMKKEIMNKNLSLEQLDLKYKNEQNKLDSEITLCAQEINDLKNLKEKQEQKILTLMNEISNKSKLLTQLNNNLDSSNQQITYLESNMSDNEFLVQKYDDILKKYELCNKTNETLQLELDEKEEINKQGFFSLIFWVVIVGIAILSFVRIKSMKKIN